MPDSSSPSLPDGREWRASRIVLAHAHSSWSYDGVLTLDDWRDLARHHGIDAVLFAEHEETGWTPARYARYVTACSSASCETVRLVPGIEFNQDGYHVLCYGLTQWPERPSSVEKLAAAVRAQRCLLCLAHPVRYGWTYPEPLLRAVDAVEVWNSNWVCEGTLGPHPKSLALARGKSMLVGQDVHKPWHLTGLWLRTISADLLEDLRRGEYVFQLGDAVWAPDALCRTSIRGWLQRGRTRVVRGGLRSYRSIRRAMKSQPLGRAIWERAAAAAHRRRRGPKPAPSRARADADLY